MSNHHGLKNPNVISTYRFEEVEEAVVLDGLGDGADVALGLVLLLLLYRLHREVLALLPVDGAPRALVDLGALEVSIILNTSSIF